MLDLPPPQVECLAQAIYSEARGESAEGKRAVGHVIMNRVKSSKFPDTPCAVIKQKSQFTFKVGNGPQWKAALEAAKNLGIDITNGSLYFRPKWNPMKRIRKITIGNHIFYK